MAKTIISASVVVKHESGSAHSNYIRCVVEMPASEYADFIALGDLTDAIPATDSVIADAATGTNSPQ